jgi:hypothetical protein
VKIKGEGKMNLLREFEKIIRLGMFLWLFVLLASAAFLFSLAKRKCIRAHQWMKAYFSTSGHGHCAVSN